MSTAISSSRIAPRTSSSPCENISPSRSRMCLQHPRAVRSLVAKPDSKWRGALRLHRIEGKCSGTEAEIIAFCRSQMSGFKTPKRWCSGPFRKPQPARSRNSCCAIRSTRRRRFRPELSGVTAQMRSGLGSLYSSTANVNGARHPQYPVPTNSRSVPHWRAAVS